MTDQQSHKLPCTDQENGQTACLNGGECFALPGVNDARDIACQCTTGWVGKRCELADQSEIAIMNSTMIIGVVAAVILLIAMVLILVLLLLRRRRRQLQQERHRDATNNSLPPTRQGLLSST